MNLSPLTVLFLALVFQEIPISTMADSQLIDHTCKGTPSYDLCLSIIWADPNCTNADLRGLAVIVANAVKNNAMTILQQIEDLKKSRPELTLTLTRCGDVYRNVVHLDVWYTLVALRLGNFSYAERRMAGIGVQSETCEKSFGKHGQTSPMTVINKAIEDVADVGRAIIGMLL